MLRQLSILAILLASMGCEQPPSFDLETPEAKLVVVSNFTRGKAVQVFVSRPSSILGEEKNDYVTDATVEIYEGDVYLETLDFVPPEPNSNEVPYYTTRNLIPEVNTYYTIQVEASCCSPATARSRIPASINFSSASISDFELKEEQETNEFHATYLLRLSFEDPSQEKNYYHISLLQQIHRFTLNEGDTVIAETYLRPLAFSSEDNTNGQVAHISGGLLVEDNTSNNGKLISFELPLNIRLKKNEELLGKLFLELRAVTEEYYRYFSDLSRQKQSSESPFAEPVIIYDNIDGGLGIFAGYNSSLDSLFLN